MKTKKALVFDYINYKGERSQRKVVPESVTFGSTEWHPKDQFLLNGWDCDKKAHRSFAMKDILSLDHEPIEVPFEDSHPDFNKPKPEQTMRFALNVMEDVMEHLTMRGIKFQSGMSRTNNIGTISLENGEYIRFNEG